MIIIYLIPLILRLLFKPVLLSRISFPEVVFWIKLIWNFFGFHFENFVDGFIVSWKTQTKFGEGIEALTKKKKFCSLLFRMI